MISFAKTQETPVGARLACDTFTFAGMARSYSERNFFGCGCTGLGNFKQ